MLKAMIDDKRPSERRNAGIKGSESEIVSQKSNRYKGKCPKGQVKGNINYLDHNIFALDNRIPVRRAVERNSELYDSTDSATRAKRSIPVLHLINAREGIETILSRSSCTSPSQV